MINFLVISVVLWLYNWKHKVAFVENLAQCIATGLFVTLTSFLFQTGSLIFGLLCFVIIYFLIIEWGWIWKLISSMKGKKNAK